MLGRFVKFKSFEHLKASVTNDTANREVAHSIAPYDVPETTNYQDARVLKTANSLDYYSMLVETIKNTEHDSAQLRALVYERARFNFKRDVLFGHSFMGLTDLVHQINEFEIAVARIEANPDSYQAKVKYLEHAKPLAAARDFQNKAVQILPPRSASPLYTGLRKLQKLGIFQLTPRVDGVVPEVRFANQLIGILALGTLFIGTVIIAGLLWHSPFAPSRVEIADRSPRSGETSVKQANSDNRGAAPTENSTKAPFPLPTSYGIYALTDNKLTELEALPISIPDSRVALSAEMKKPSSIELANNKPEFIFFRRDLLNNAPQKITLRIIARMT